MRIKGIEGGLSLKNVKVPQRFSQWERQAQNRIKIQQQAQGWARPRKKRYSGQSRNRGMGWTDTRSRKASVMWQTVGEFFRDKGADFPMESFKMRLRSLKPEHLMGSRPWKYRREDLERAYTLLCENSLYMRKRMLK